MAAGKNQLSIYTTYHESFLALSVSIRVDKHQLMMETPSSSQAPVLRYRDITFTTEYLKESLSAVCPVLGVHNVARVRQGASLPLVEVDFTDEKALERFCKSISDGVFQFRLQDRLKGNFFSTEHEVKVTIKLHLIMPNAERKQRPVSREVTTTNYRECFSLIRESAVFEFTSFNITHDDAHGVKETIQQELVLRNLLQELTEVAPIWLTVGVFLNIELYKLEIIKRDNGNQSMDCLRVMLATWLRGTDASPAALVQALRLAGMTVLARKVAVRYGITVIDTKSTHEPTQPATSPQSTASDLIKFFTQLFALPQDSTTQSVPDLGVLASQKEGIAARDAQHLALSEQLRELRNNEERVTESFEQTKSSLESVKDQIDNLKRKQQSLIEKKEIKQSSKQWLIKQRRSKTGEELFQVERMIEDTEEAVAELIDQIDELESKIKAQSEHVARMSAQLVQKEQEMKQLETKMNEVQKEKSFLESQLEEDRKNFEIKMQTMIDKQQQSEKSLESKYDEEKIKFQNEIQTIRNELKLSETREEMMRDELSHKRTLELAQAQSSILRTPLQQVDDTSIQPVWTRAQTAHECIPIADWLMSYKLSEYVTLFENNGYDNTDFLLGISVEELTELGVTKPGHRRKIMSALNQLRPKEHFLTIKPASVGEWLMQLGLSQYEERIMESGYDDIDFVSDYTVEELMIDIGMTKKGHLKRLSKGLQELLNKQESELAASSTFIEHISVEATRPSSHEPYVKAVSPIKRFSTTGLSAEERETSSLQQSSHHEAIYENEIPPPVPKHRNSATGLSAGEKKTSPLLQSHKQTRHEAIYVNEVSPPVPEHRNSRTTVDEVGSIPSWTLARSLSIPAVGLNRTGDPEFDNWLDELDLSRAIFEIDYLLLSNASIDTSEGDEIDWLLAHIDDMLADINKDLRLTL